MLLGADAALVCSRSDEPRLGGGTFGVGAIPESVAWRPLGIQGYGRRYARSGARSYDPLNGSLLEPANVCEVGANFHTPLSIVITVVLCWAAWKIGQKLSTC